MVSPISWKPCAPPSVSGDHEPRRSPSWLAPATIASSESNPGWVVPAVVAGAGLPAAGDIAPLHAVSATHRRRDDSRAATHIVGVSASDPPELSSDAYGLVGTILPSG